MKRSRLKWFALCGILAICVASVVQTPGAAAQGAEQTRRCLNFAAYWPVERQDGRVDVDATIRALADLGADGFVYEDIKRAEQYESFLAFLETANEAGMKVWLVMGSPHTKDAKPPMGIDYMEWIRRLASLAVQYPCFQGIHFDDFRCGTENLFTLEYVKRMLAVRDEVNPRFKLLPGVYLRAFYDYRIRQKGWIGDKGTYAGLRTAVTVPAEAKRCVLECILSDKTTYLRGFKFAHQILAGGEVVWERGIRKANPRNALLRLDLTRLAKEHNPLQIEYRVAYIRSTGTQWFDAYVTNLAVKADGEEIPTEWTACGNTDKLIVTPVDERLGPYFEVMDGATVFSNSISLYYQP